jgi:hypothetical protein
VAVAAEVTTRGGAGRLDLGGGMTDAGRGGAAMPEEPMTEPDATLPPGEVEAGPSTDLVLRARRPAVPVIRRWPDVVVRARTQLMRLRQNPAAMVAVSTAATVGSAVVTTGLRRSLRRSPSSPAGRTTSVAVGGYIVHEVHVIHHVVHHVIRPPVD